MATLKELSEFYSLEDVWILNDILAVENYHKWLGNKLAQEQAELAKAR